MRTVARAGVAAALLLAGPARAEVSGALAVLSDYRYRGASISDGRPVAQAGIAVDHASGAYVGALLSYVKVSTDISGLGGLAYGGYTHALAGAVSWEVGVVTHRFPAPGEPPRYDYAEWYVGVGDTATNAHLFHSTDYYGVGSHSWYLEANHTMPLLGRYRLSVHLGYLVVGHSYYGVEGSRLDYKAGVGVDLAGFMVDLSLTGTNRGQPRCPVENGHCTATVVVSVSRQF